MVDTVVLDPAPRNPDAENGLYPFPVPLIDCLLQGAFIPPGDADVTRTVSLAGIQIEAYSTDQNTINASLQTLVQVPQAMIEASSVTVDVYAQYYDNTGLAEQHDIEGLVAVVPAEGGPAATVGTLAATPLTTSKATYSIVTLPGSVPPGSLLMIETALTIRAAAGGDSGAILNAIVVS